jgi:hypothetical protein
MEARTILLMRIDVNRDEKLSFEEFLVLFEGEFPRLVFFSQWSLSAKDMNRVNQYFRNLSIIIMMMMIMVIICRGAAQRAGEKLRYHEVQGVGQGWLWIS